jgi:4'-phosphopantetheinyl transferase
MNIEIEENQVHIWQAHIKTDSAYYKDISKSLSPDELERANNFRFPKDRERFIIRRYQLRLILSKYCGCQPFELIFGYNSCKKPFIRSPEFKEVKFNMSCSGDLMLVGLCNQNEIGIDIEKVCEITDLDNIASENFSLPELKYLNATLDRTNAFYKIWTRKEAFIKAIGKGMYYPLKSFCVEVNSSGSCEHLVIFNHLTESKLWRTAEINTSDSYIASMAIKSDRFLINYFLL